MQKKNMLCFALILHIVSLLWHLEIWEIYVVSANWMRNSKSFKIFFLSIPYSYHIRYNHITLESILRYMYSFTCSSTWLGSVSQINSSQSWPWVFRASVSWDKNSLNMIESKFFDIKKMTNQSPMSAFFINMLIKPLSLFRSFSNINFLMPGIITTPIW